MKNSDQNSQRGDNNNTQKNTSDKRRKMLVGGGVMSTGALLPETWKGPVFNSIVLPAHAQTSTMAITSGMFAGSGAIPTP